MKTTSAGCAGTTACPAHRPITTTNSASTTSPSASTSATTSSTSGSAKASSTPAASATGAWPSPSRPRSRPPADSASPTRPELDTSTHQPLTETQHEDTVDEISYRRHHRYLTTVADHATGAIVWCQPGRNSATLQGFFDDLGNA